MILYVAFKVYRDKSRQPELLGVFDDSALIAQTYKHTNTNAWIIGYGILRANEAFPIRTTHWPKGSWVWLE
jgi:hypothetical protein